MEEIEDFGIKREVFEKPHPTDYAVSESYLIITKSNHSRKENKQIRFLKKFVEKLKNIHKI